MVSEDLTASGFRKPRQRTWVRSVLALAGVGLTAALIVPRLPEWNELVGALKAVDGRWLAVAAVAQAVSLVLFAELQHKLLGALGAPVPLSRLVAISVSRSALALVAPAGSAVSAGFAFRQFRRAGACRAIAARVLVFAGVVSFAGLLLLYLVQFVASRWPQALAYMVEHGGDLVAAGVLAVILGWLAIDCGGAVLRRWVGVISPRAWGTSLTAAAGNWLADLLCLYAATRAAHVAPDFGDLATVYLVTQVARQVPLTPGGVGVIEATLLGGLAALGVAESAAFVAVMGYRFMSFWLVLPAGLVAWLTLKRDGLRHIPSAKPEPPVQLNTL